MIQVSDIAYSDKYADVSISDLNELGVFYYEIYYRNKWWSALRYNDNIRVYEYDGDEKRLEDAISFFLKEMYASFFILRNIDIHIIRDTDFTDILAIYIRRRLLVVIVPSKVDIFKHIVDYIELNYVQPEEGALKEGLYTFSYEDILEYGDKVDIILAEQDIIRRQLILDMLAFKYNIHTHKQEILNKMNLELYTESKTKKFKVDGFYRTVRGKMYKVPNLSKSVFGLTRKN